MSVCTAQQEQKIQQQLLQEKFLLFASYKVHEEKGPSGISQGKLRRKK